MEPFFKSMLRKISSNPIETWSLKEDRVRRADARGGIFEDDLLFDTMHSQLNSYQLRGKTYV